MKYTYGVGIMTFGGAHRVEALLSSMISVNKAASLSLMKRRIVVEDPTPQESHHLDLVHVVNEFPEWELITLPEWSNAQGAARGVLENLNTDFVFLIEDDILGLGDPFHNIIGWIENAPDELITRTGAIQMSQFQAATELRSNGIFPITESFREVQEVFYDDPFDKWFRNPEKLHDHRIPTLGMNSHGQCSCINKKAYIEAGGYDSRWHAFDQVLSYRIWLNTSYLIYTVPTDPFYHCGGCAQAGDHFGIRAVEQGNRERCREIFGKYPEEIEKHLLGVINPQTLKWHPILGETYNKLMSQGIMGD